MKLVIANKLYSSWSLRPWLAMKAFGIPFEEIVIPLHREDTAEKISAYSPSGKVPVLIDGEVKVWDSLAILDYINDSFPEIGLWPSDLHALGFARSISAEMHSGFASLRKECPMNLGLRYAPQPLSEPTQKDVARITMIWREARERFGANGPFLFSSFTAADAMFMPVVTRFFTYSVELGCEVATAYANTMLNLKPFHEWRNAALQEPWIIDDYGFDYPILETFHPSLL